MNRRKFLFSSAITAGALSITPTATLASNNYKTYAGLKSFAGFSNNLSLSSLPSSFLKTCNNLITDLKSEDYSVSNHAIKLNSNCYAISIQKSSLLGFKSNELALLINEKGNSNYYILEEELATEFTSLIENYKYNMNALNFNYSLSDFAFPVEVLESKKGLISIFSFKNKLNNTITLKRVKKQSKAIVC